MFIVIKKNIYIINVIVLFIVRRSLSGVIRYFEKE